MSIAVVKTSKLLEPPVDCFMPSSSSGFGFFVGLVVAVILDSAVKRHPGVRAVCFNHFIWIQHFQELAFKCLFVGPDTGWTRAINPHNVTCLNANC